MYDHPKITYPESKLDRRFCIAPMMDWTDRHCRYLLRLLFRQAMLYTEMVTTQAILRGDRHCFLDYSQAERPLALQLGGSEPEAMATCARIAEDYAYDEVNINVGCPSERVKSGAFGACLMAEPETIAECVTAMRKAVNLPITVKTRIGIDDCDDYADLDRFVRVVAEAGCSVFIVHARKAWLQGLSPKENRDIPPLCYESVYQLKRNFPALEIVINGGLKAADQIVPQLRYVDGVMIGREAYKNPYKLVAAYRRIFGEHVFVPDRFQLVEQYLVYINEQRQKNVNLRHMARHMLGLFQGINGARYWRRYLSEHIFRENADESVIVSALRGVHNQEKYKI